MAYPQVESTAKTGISSSTSSPSINLPSTNEDDLLIMLIGVDNANEITISAPSGWTQLNTGTYTTRIRWSILARKASGGEGSSVAVSLSGNADSGAAIVYDISGWGGTVADDVDVAYAGDIGLSEYPDPYSVTADWGADDNLFIATAWARFDDATFTAAPTNYTGLEYIVSGAGSPIGFSAGSATREYNAASDDPGTFTLSESERWAATSLVVKPGTSGGGGSGGSTLSAADLSHTNSLDGVSLSSVINLVLSDLSHAQGLDGISIGQRHYLTCDDLLHVQSLDTVTLVLRGNLIIQDLLHGQALDNVNLVQRINIDVGDLQHTQTLDGVEVVSGQVLSVDDLGNSQSLESVSLTQTHLLELQDLAHAQGLDTVNFSLAEGVVTVTFSMARPGASFVGDNPYVTWGNG